jgi:hypothetical protein
MSNIEHRISNTERQDEYQRLPLALRTPSSFDIRCSMFDILASLRGLAGAATL